jgi:hypothetical protein
MGRTHILFGAACYAVIPEAPIAGIVGAAVFATFPDLDQKQATASKWLPPLGWFVRLWAGGHRRRTHLRCASGRRKGRFSWVAATVLAGLVAGLFALNPVLGWAFGVGYVSHLLGDTIPYTGGKLESMLKPVIVLILIAGLLVRAWIWVEAV